MPRANPPSKALSAIAALLTLATAGASQVLVARGGHARSSVVVAENASDTERQAARELALFLHLATGGEFPVLNAAPDSGSRLLVGDRGQALRLGLHDQLRPLHPTPSQPRGPRP